jgi:putative aldouronate transport system permease protein
MKIRKIKNLELLIIFVPTILFFLVFCYAPMAGLLIAFNDYVMSDGILGSRWVGLDNFKRLFFDGDFIKVIRNTLIISSLRMTLGFIAPIILALLLNELRCTLYKRAVQTLSYLPYFFSWVILGGIFIMFLSGEGPVNSLIKSCGGEGVPFLTSGPWFITVLILSGIWQSAGWGAIIYLASLSGVNPDLYEAAEVDGANRWQQTLHITLPALVPTIITLFILSVGQILSAGFDQVYNMYNPMVYDYADILDTYVLRKLLSLEFGLGTAAGFFKAVVGMLMIVISNFVAKKISGGEQGVW